MASDKDEGGASPEGLLRVVWCRLNDGDYRKFRAESNDSATGGGGARDLRFGRYPSSEGDFESLFA